MILTFDTEQTTYSKGNPFDTRNRNVLISWIKDNGTVESGFAFTENRGQFEPLYKTADLVVGFNIKYDLHWGRKLFDFVPERVWDCQLCEFFLGRQSPPYPSLNDVAQKYTGRTKDPAVEDYWNRGVQTDEIPREILSRYGQLDAELTYQVYLAQRDLLPPHQRRLFSLMCQDLLVLQEMEWNGLIIDEDLAEQKAQELDNNIQKIQAELNIYHNVPDFNWASNDHLSALLYGGKIIQVIREPNGIYKSGSKVGHPKFRKVEKVFHLPRLHKPIRNSALKKEGLWATDEPTLRKLTGDPNLLNGILEIKRQEKLISTYLRGFPKKRRLSSWNIGEIHSTLNQCVAATGRLTSTSPNGQNLPLEAIGDIFPTRYP